MEKTLKGIGAVSIAFIMALTIIPLVGSSQAFAKAGKCSLVKKVIVQKYDKAKKKWITSETTSYKYNKHKDPVKITDKYHDSREGSDSIVIKYDYRNGKRNTHTIKRDGDTDTVTFNKKGNPIKRVYKSPVYGDQVTTYSYYKQGTIKQETSESKEENGKTEIYKTKYSTVFKKKLPVKVTLTEFSDGIWGTPRQTQHFNKKGFIQEVKLAEVKSLVKYKMKKGRIAMVAQDNKGFNGDWKERKKIIYTKGKISKARYRNMINEIVWGGEIQFCWY